MAAGVTCSHLFFTGLTPTTKTMHDSDDNRFQEKLIERFRSACTRGGLKITHQREQIYLYLAASSSHPTAETIYNSLKSRLTSLSLDTVYRTVATLEQKGLIQRVQTVNAQARYEARMSEHHHFICNSCDRVVDFDWPSFTDTRLPAELAAIGRISSRAITVSGICSDCIKTEDAQAVK